MFICATISGPEDMYIDDKYKDKISRILHGNPLTVNDSVTAESVDEMLYLDTNSCSSPHFKRHQKEPLVIESESKKPKERLTLRRKQSTDKTKLTRLHKSKRIAQIKEEIKKSWKEDDNVEINSNFLIHCKFSLYIRGN